MADMYAWSPILLDGEVIAPGTKVTKSDLSASDEQWDEWVRGGSIRPKEWPVPEGYAGSVIDFYQDKLKEVQESAGATVEEALVEISLADVAAAEPEPAKASGSGNKK